MIHILPFSCHPLCIGLLGGSFNPAHEGHLHISLEALKRLKLDAVWWLVSPQNPLKPGKDLQPYDKRLTQARTLTAPHRRIFISDIERTLKTRYTIDTVKSLKRKFPCTKFIWLMGADNLASFHRWKNWRELMRLLPIAVLDRAPFSHTALRRKAALAYAKNRLPEAIIPRLKARKPPSWAYLPIPRHPASSTQIRAKKSL